MGRNLAYHRPRVDSVFFSFHRQLRADSEQTQTWFYDGGADVHKDFSSSGEEMSDGLMYEFAKHGPIDQANATAIAENNVAIRNFRKEYMERWNKTKEITGTGRPMDGIIAPLAPSPASEPLQFKYYNYTTWVNLLDYPSCVVPVTQVNKKIDLPYENFKPLSDIDEELINGCKNSRHDPLVPS